MSQLTLAGTLRKKPSGRKRSPLRVHFSATRSNRCVCIHCSASVSSQLQQITNHLKSCHKYQETLSNSPSNDDDSKLTEAPRTKKRSRSQLEEDCPPTDARPRKRRKIEKPITTHLLPPISREQKKILDKAAARFAFHNHNLSVVESVYFRDFVHRLYPTYTPPCRKDVSNKYLEENLKEVNEETYREFREFGSSSIALDGGTDVRRKSCIIITGVARSEPRALDLVFPGARSQDAAYYFEVFDATRKILLAEGIHVHATVCDNCSVMRLFRKNVKKAYPTEIIGCPGCACHGINKVIEDFCVSEFAAHVIAAAKDLAAIFRAGAEQAWLTEEVGRDHVGGLSPPTETRWCSEILLMKTLIKLRASLAMVCIKHSDEISKKVVEKVNSTTLWDDFSEVVEIADPLCTALTFFEGNVSLSCVWKYWLSLEERYGEKPVGFDSETKWNDFEFDSPQELIRCSLDRRWDLISDDCHVLAYVFDFHNRPFTIVAEDIADMMKIFERLFPEEYPLLWTQFTTYRTEGNDIFSSGMFDSRVEMEAMDAWKSLYDTEYDQLARLAVKTLAIPCTEVSCERGFSVLGDMDHANYVNERKKKLFIVNYNDRM